MSGRDDFNPHAFGVPYDPNNDSSCDLTSDNVQEAIDELCISTSVSASPGFTWGDRGKISDDSWLLNDNVPSNKTGRNFSLFNGVLKQLSVSNQKVNTFDIELYEHDGTTFTLLASVSIVSQRSNVFDVSDFGVVNITKGLELAIKVVNGSGKNIVVQAIASGTLTP